MIDAQSVDRPANQLLQAGATALLVLFLTAIHHIYGAVVYDTPWRLHIVFVAVPFALAIAGALALAGSSTGSRRRIATWIAVGLILIFPVTLIGAYEGGYNHLVKNILYFTLGEQAARVVCPEGICELPNDLMFEVTGIAQFFAAIPAAVLAIRLAAGSSGR